GEEDIGEDRPLSQDELAAALVVDRNAEDVAREQIARELHAAKLAADGAGQGAREGRLADAGDVLDEKVTPREQRGERELDGLLLRLERGCDGLSQSLQRGELLCDQGCRSGHGAETSMAQGRSSQRAISRSRSA